MVKEMTNLISNYINLPKKQIGVWNIYLYSSPSFVFGYSLAETCILFVCSEGQNDACHMKNTPTRESQVGNWKVKTKKKFPLLLLSNYRQNTGLKAVPIYYQKIDRFIIWIRLDKKNLLRLMFDRPVYMCRACGWNFFFVSPFIILFFFTFSWYSFSIGHIFCI
jgi:hypothetical protein